MSILPVIFDPVSDAVELDAMGSTSVWWSLDQNFIYNLSTGRYMRGGAGSSLALSLSGVPSGQPVQGVGMTVGAADNPVVVQGLGEETVVDAASPTDWDPINATLTGNGDGSASIASVGEFYHRSGSSSGPWQAGVLQRGFFVYEEGTSGAGLFVLQNVDTANVYAQAAGYAGSLVITHDTGCTFAITSQTESNGVHRIEYEFTSDFDVTNTQIAFGPNSDVVGEDVTVVSGSLKQVFPWDGYDPRGEPYAETLTQFVENPTFTGAVGAPIPDNYYQVGVVYNTTVLAAENIDGVNCHPVSYRRVNETGTEGMQPRIDGLPVPLGVGSHLITYYVRRPAGVSGARFVLYTGGGNPGNLELMSAAEVDALTSDVWVRKTTEVTVVLEGNLFGPSLDPGAVGTGLDLALLNVVLNTAQDVESQTERGAFSRILAGDGFSSTVFPSNRDLVTGGGFDTQADVDLWTGVNGAALTLSGGAMRVTNTEADNGAGFRSVSDLRDGGVYCYTGERGADNVAGGVDYHIGSVEGFGTYAASAVYSDGPKYFLKTVSGELRLYALLNGSTIGTWREHDNISLQEVEPGVVVQAVCILSDVDDNQILALTDNDENSISVRRSSGGKAELVIEIGGVETVYTSTDDLTADAEITATLEVTNTDGGCFAAFFMDGDFLVGSDSFTYQDEINQLSLAPVAGTTIIKEVYGK